MKEKYKNILIGALIPIIAYGAYCYGKAFKTQLDDTSKMRDFMQNSSRGEYVIINEREYLVREKFFPIKDNEFKGLDSKFFYNHGESVKRIVANQVWGEIIRKENKFLLEKGKKISVPIRESH